MVLAVFFCAAFFCISIISSAAASWNSSFLIVSAAVSSADMLDDAGRWLVCSLVPSYMIETANAKTRVP